MRAASEAFPTSVASRHSGSDAGQRAAVPFADPEYYRFGSRAFGSGLYRGLPHAGAALPVLVAFSLVSSVACKSRPPAPILTWHEIGADAQPATESEGGWRVPQSRFIAQLDAISGAGFHTVPLSALLTQLEGGPALPQKSVVLTFDDGTQDHLERVLPALRAHKMVGVFFVVAGKIRADEAHRAVEKTPEGEKRYLTWPELIALQDAGMELGSHGLTHARMPDLGEAAALEELEQSRALLSAGLGRKVELLAWPYNSVRAATRELAKKAGYRAAVAGVVHGSNDVYALYRIPITAETDPVALVESLSP